MLKRKVLCSVDYSVFDLYISAEIDILCLRLANSGLWLLLINCTLMELNDANVGETVYTIYYIIAHHNFLKSCAHILVTS